MKPKMPSKIFERRHGKKTSCHAQCQDYLNEYHLVIPGPFFSVLGWLIMLILDEQNLVYPVIL